MPRTALLAVTGLTLLLAAIGCSTAATPQAPTAQPEGASAVSTAAIRSVGKHKGDYLPAHNWKIEIDGVLVGGFKDMSLNIDGKSASGFKEIVGLESEIEVIEFKDGDDPITHKRAGKAKYKNITLKRGFVADDRLLAWFEGGETAARKSGSVIYLDRAGQEVLRYNFFEAWPSATRGAKIVMDRDTGIAIASEIELVVTDFERDHFALGKAKHDTAKNSVGNIR